jgi:hypothetical protein
VWIEEEYQSISGTGTGMSLVILKNYFAFRKCPFKEVRLKQKYRTSFCSELNIEHENFFITCFFFKIRRKKENGTIRDSKYLGLTFWIRTPI